MGTLPPSMVLAVRDTRPSAVGGAATQIHAGEIHDLDPNPEVRGELWYGDGLQIGLAAQMMRDPHVRKSVDGRVAPLAGAYWDFEPASDAPVSLEAADLARHVFFERLDWHRFIRLGTIGYTRDGFFLAELTDDTAPINRERFPLHPGRGTGIVYTGIHHRPAFSKDRWIQSKRNPAQIDGIDQRLLGSDVEEPEYREIRLSKGALLFRITWDQEGANFDGFPRLRSAWGPFKKKRLLETINMIRHEREGAPVPELSEPDANQGNAAEGDERTTAREILQGLRSHEQSYLHLPPGWKFRWVPGNGNPTEIQRDIEACNNDVAYNLDVAWMRLGSADKTGSFAMASTHQGHYHLSVEQEARVWEYALNVGQDGFSPVERLIRLNYGPEVGVPRLVVRNMPTKDWSAIFTAIPQLVQARALVVDKPLRDFIRVLGALPKEDPATATPFETAPTSNAPKTEPVDVEDDAEDAPDDEEETP